MKAEMKSSQKDHTFHYLGRNADVDTSVERNDFRTRTEMKAKRC